MNKKAKKNVMSQYADILNCISEYLRNTKRGRDMEFFIFFSEKIAPQKMSSY